MFKKISFNNIRCMIGQKKNGVQFGGDTILKSMKIYNPSPHVEDFNMARYHDLSVYNNMTYWRENKDIMRQDYHTMSRVSYVNHINILNTKDYTKGYNLIYDNLKKNIFNINIGGDHSISISTIKPLIDLYNKDLLVVWIDAHADINTLKSSKTNNTHGMPVASIMQLKDCWDPINMSLDRRNYKSLENFPLHKLHKSNILYVGIRDLDDFEEEIIQKRKIKFYRYFTNCVINYINKHPAKYIHISCDIDSMDPSIMPSTGTKVNGGLSLEDVELIINTCKSRLISFDLVEFNPLIGNSDEVDKTIINIQRLLNNVIR